MSLSRDIAQSRIGAQVGASGVDYRVWSPDRRLVEVVVERDNAARALPLVAEGGGYWTVHDRSGLPGDLYRFRLDGGDLLPDVASRFQPESVHGRSECIDAAAYPWKCTSWRRPAWRGQVTYEMHVGTFTNDGSFRAAIGKLDLIRDVGVEAIELMPLADFAGTRNWGYDGVALFAPARCYGRPDELRAFVDAAHARGLAVILDVVYNHVGPQGSYLEAYSPAYFASGRESPWGKGYGLSGGSSGPVRDFLRSNAAYWLDDFRFDGLRLDATHAVVDDSPTHLLAEIAELAHARGAFVIGEDERNSADLIRLEGKRGFDGLWADDFHHQVRVATTGTRERYFSAYSGTPADIVLTLAEGWTYVGQSFLPWNGRPRGTRSAHLPTSALVHCIENHDQVGNRARGERLEQLTTPAQFRAASMLLCLGPYAPLLFMGQEWAASTPFLFFTDHGGELGGQVSRGRRREFGHGTDDPFVVPDPEDMATFVRSKLQWGERNYARHAATIELYRACLRERQFLAERSAFRRECWTVSQVGSLIALRYPVPDRERLLLVALNDGSELPAKLPESLRPIAGDQWNPVLATESARFGGTGEADRKWPWGLSKAGAVWLAPQPKGGADAAA